MNLAHAHLVLNHLPHFGTLFAAALLLVAMLRKNDEFVRVALYFVVAMSLLAIPAYVTGKYAFEIIESMPDVSELFMDDHEEAAWYAFVALEACGAFALAALAAYRESNLPKWIAPSILVLLLLAFGLTTWTANLGGSIRHIEARSGFD